MTNKFLLLFPLLLTLASCDRCKNIDPEPNPPSGPEKFGKLSILWKKPYEGNELFGCSAPAIFENRAIFSNFNAAGEEFFYALDADNGDEQFWKWNDYINDNAKSKTGKRLPLVYKNIMCIHPGNGLIGVDMLTGQTLWKTNFSSSGGQSVFGKYTLMSCRIDNNTESIRMIDMENGKWRDIFKRDTIKTPFRSFSTPTLSLETAGSDSILYIVFNQSFQQNDGSLKNEARLFAYNITKQVELWSKPFQSVVVKPIILGDRLFLSGDSIHCLNRNTGEVIWKNQKFKNAGGSWGLHENRLVIIGQGSGSQVHAYDPNTGALVWNIAHGGNTSDPLFYKGIMYFTSASDGRLWAVRVSTGERIWHENSPDTVNQPDAVWSWGVNIDTTRNRLYGGSFRTAYCLEPAK